MQIEQLDSFGNAYSRSLQWRAVMLKNVFECLTWPPSTATIEANRFRNCPIARFTWSTCVPLLYVPPCSWLVGILLAVSGVIHTGCHVKEIQNVKHCENKIMQMTQLCYIGAQCTMHGKPHNQLQTFNSSNSSAVVYGLGHHSSRSRGKCIVNSVSRDIASLLLISLETGYLSCTQPTDADSF